MSVLTVANLVDLVRELNLLTPKQWDELASLRVEFPEPVAVVREMMRLGWLTSYQGNNLIKGQKENLLIGTYVITDVIGEGGMGQVFKGRHQLMNRVVAIKCIRRDRLADAQAVPRFLREIQVLAQLIHPNIVIAYDAAQMGDTLLLAMEFVDGVDLAELLKKHGPFPVGQACDCIRQAATGLQHAHERGLVHRDIKPHNLLLTRDDGVVKILDLGLARLQRQGDSGSDVASITQQGTGVGTPLYMAPEQGLDSSKADIRSDIYGLGCTLYHLLTGRPPFMGKTMSEVLLKHHVEEPVRIEQVRPEAGADLGDVVRRMMAKKPEDRYQAPFEVVAALQPFCQTPNLEALTRSSAPPLADGEADLSGLQADDGDSSPAHSTSRRAIVPVTPSQLGLEVTSDSFPAPNVEPAPQTASFATPAPQYSPGSQTELEGVRPPEPSPQDGGSGTFVEGFAPRPSKVTQQMPLPPTGLTSDSKPSLSRMSSGALPRPALPTRDTMRGPESGGGPASRPPATSSNPSVVINPMPARPAPTYEPPSYHEPRSKKPLIFVLLLLALGGLAAATWYFFLRGEPEIVNSVGMKFALVPKGKFAMGSPKSEAGSTDDERDEHSITLSAPIYFSVYEVTQEQFERVMGKNPSFFSGKEESQRELLQGVDTKRLPVEQVTYEQAVEFCRRLSELDEEKSAGRVYRLPTEAEWEYACRAGTRTAFSYGSSLTPAQAQFDASKPYGGAQAREAAKRPNVVGSFPPNAFGLHDMHGNVMEWCHDWYAANYYVIGSTIDPRGPDDGKNRVLRGGAWNSPAVNCRSGYRHSEPPATSQPGIGFRVVIDKK